MTSGIPEAEMGASGPPGRGVASVRVHEKGLEVLCDCGTATVLVIDPDDAAQVTGPQDVPFHCEGCNSVHWLTLGPLTQEKQ
jgi:hypothetical protein